MRRSLTCFAVMLLATTVVRLQQPSAENEFCHADFAKFLVAQQISESNSVTDVPKRVRILIRSADFLWSYDEPGARSHFTEAFRLAGAHYRDVRAEIARSGREAATLGPTAWDQRFGVIRAIAKRDPIWAGRLADGVITELDKNAEFSSEDDKQREAAAILNAAADIAGRNADISRKLFRRAHRYSLDYAWYFALFNTAEHDATLAEQVYLEALQNYRNSSVRQLLLLSAFPFARQRVFGPDRMSLATTVSAQLQENPTLEAAFLNVLYSRIGEIASQANAGPSARRNFLADPAYMVSSLRELQPIVSDRHPSLAARHALATAQAASLMTEETQRDLIARERTSILAPRSFDERMQELEDAFEKGTLSDAMIVTIIVMQDKLSEAQFASVEPWLDRIKDEKVRAETTSHFWFKRSTLAAEERRFRDASRYSDKVNEADFRALLAFTIADKQLEDLNNTAEAQLTIAAVSRAAETLGNTLVRARIRLALAKKYGELGSSFAINELSDAVRVINTLKDAEVTTSTIFRQVEGKDFSHYAAYQLPGADIEGTFRELSKTDISLPLSNARAIDDRYLRALAVLAVASNCIEKPKPKEQ